MSRSFAIMALTALLSFFMPVTTVTVNPQCDFEQILESGVKYFIYNVEYPGIYPPSTACRWRAESVPGSSIVMSCDDIDLPESNNCQGDRLAVSLTGNSNFADAQNYCGKGQISVVTEGNLLAVGLFATAQSSGGRFVCTITSIQTQPTPTPPSDPNPPIGPCDCGWKNQRRIIGGHETGVNEYPSMAGLLDSTTHDVFCGSTIIASRYALTAAHCLNKRQVNLLGLLVGDHDVTTGSDTAYAHLYALQTTITHPQYNSATQQNDLALLKTLKPIVFSLYVGPACLPFLYTNYDFYAQNVTALGWGVTEVGGPKSDTLQAVKLEVVANSQCAANVVEPVTAQEMCTFAPNKDTCQSDSGGPLLWQDPSSRRLQIVGITSFGRACAVAVPTTVNTRVTSYLSWIVSASLDAGYCIK